MPFATTDSYTATDANNTLRGLHRNNTSVSTSGTGEDDLASVTITGGTIGATGRIVVEAVGTITGAAGNKTIKMYFGGTAIYTSGPAAGVADWYIRAVISNTATGAQRISILSNEHSAVTAGFFDYTTTAIDTTASVILKVTGEVANAADTITQTMFEVQIQQIT